MKCIGCGQKMLECKDGYYCETIGCQGWVPKKSEEPAFAVVSGVIPSVGEVYTEDGTCVGIWAVETIREWGLEFKEVAHG